MSIIGSRVFDYEITRRIKAGGMGVVYEARRTWGIGEKVAIKFLLDQLRDDERIRQRFIREAEILEQLRHPCIVRILGLDPEKDAFVMEFVEGITLAEQLRKDPLVYREPAAAVSFMIKLLMAFDYAHHVSVEIKGKTENGIIHRDIKPSNIIVQPNGDPKILDFGISRILTLESTLTDPKLQMGSVAYMSPEQVVNPVDVDWRSDIYSLGVSLWELFVGKSPYPQITTYEVVVAVQNRIRHEPLPLLAETLDGLSEDERSFFLRIDRVINKATEKDRNKRYQNCQEMQAALEALLEPEIPANRENEPELEFPTAIASKILGNDLRKATIAPTPDPKPLTAASIDIPRFAPEPPPKGAPGMKILPAGSPASSPRRVVLYGGLVALCITIVLIVWRPWKEGDADATNTATETGNAKKISELNMLDEIAKAAKADSLHDIANSYFGGSHGKPKDFTEAARFYRMASDLGSPSAQTRLASLYETGTGVKQDQSEAIKLYKEAASKGNIEAQGKLKGLAGNH
jgi:serine/threonine-protein kinase